MRNVVVLTPVPPDGLENGLTVPLRQAIQALSERSATSVVQLNDRRGWRVLRMGNLLIGRDCFASTRWGYRVQSTQLGRICRDAIVVGFLGTSARAVLSVPARRRICIVQDSITRISERNGQLEHLPAGLRAFAGYSNRRYEQQSYSRMDGIQVTTITESAFMQELGVTAPILVNTNGVAVPDSLPTSAGNFDVAMLGDYRDLRNRRIAVRGLEAAEQLAADLNRRITVALIGWKAGDVPTGGCTRVRIRVFDGIDDPSVPVSQARAFLCLDPDATGVKNSVLSMLAGGLPGVVTPEVAEAFGVSASGPALRLSSPDALTAAESLRTLVDGSSYSLDARYAAWTLARSFSWEKYRERLADFVFGVERPAMLSGG